MLCLCINIERKYKKVKVDFNNTKTFNYTDLHGNMKPSSPLHWVCSKKEWAQQIVVRHSETIMITCHVAQ